MTRYKDLSLRLDTILESCGISADVRRIRTETARINDILNGFTRLNDRTYNFGSAYEGSYTLDISGGFRGGSRGSLKPPSGPTLFRFHGEFQKILCEIRQTNPPFLHLNPLFRNPGSAPGYGIGRGLC